MKKQKLQGDIYLYYLKYSIPLLSALKAVFAFTRDVFFFSDLTKLVNFLQSQNLLLHFGLAILAEKSSWTYFTKKMQFIVIGKFPVLKKNCSRYTLYVFPN